MITDDNKDMKWYSYYHFTPLYDNKDFVMITDDNKDMKWYSYYHFNSLCDNEVLS
jgi:hypothetical protein